MKIAVIGECMVEFSQQQSNQYKLGYGGDTLNTAIYLSRCGGTADYFTVLGNDPFSADMLAEWKNEGVGIDHVKMSENKMPGLYLIKNDENGERYFHYWRENSPAKALFSDFPETFVALREYPIIFLSGITLSLYSAADLDTLFSFIAQYRKNGGVVVFDNNYRERNWPNKSKALNTFSIMMRNTDVALLSFDDELVLYGQHSINECVDRWNTNGVTEIVVKNGEHGCTLLNNGITSFIPLNNVCKPVDTTAAGDSFNGAYLAAKLKGKSMADCVKLGQMCASVVVMHKGAIIDDNISLKESA